MIIDNLSTVIPLISRQRVSSLINSNTPLSLWGTHLLTIIKPAFRSLSDEMKKNHHAAITVYLIANSVFLLLLDFMVRPKNDQPSKNLFHKMVKPFACELAVGSAIAAYNILLSKVTDYRLSSVVLVTITTACLAYRVVFKPVFYYLANRASVVPPTVLTHHQKKSHSAESLEQDSKSAEIPLELVQKENEDLKEDKRKLEERLKAVELTLESTQKEKVEFLANAEKEKEEILLLQKSPSEALEKVQMERKHIEAQLKQTKEDLKSANSSLEEREQASRATAEKLVQVEEERDQALKKFEELTSERERQKSKLEEATKRMENIEILKQDLALKTDELEKVKGGLSETASNSQTKRIESLENQISDLEKALVEACRQIKEENDKREELQQKVDELSKENSGLKKSLDTFTQASV